MSDFTGSGKPVVRLINKDKEIFLILSFPVGKKIVFLKKILKLLEAIGSNRNNP